MARREPTRRRLRAVVSRATGKAVTVGVLVWLATVCALSVVASKD